MRVSYVVQSPRQQLPALPRQSSAKTTGDTADVDTLDPYQEALDSVRRHLHSKHESARAPTMSPVMDHTSNIPPAAEHGGGSLGYEASSSRHASWNPPSGPSRNAQRRQAAAGGSSSNNIEREVAAIIIQTYWRRWCSWKLQVGGSCRPWSYTYVVFLAAAGAAMTLVPTVLTGLTLYPFAGCSIHPKLTSVLKNMPSLQVRRAAESTMLQRLANGALDDAAPLHPQRAVIQRSQAPGTDSTAVPMSLRAQHSRACMLRRYTVGLVAAIPIPLHDNHIAVQ
jgi:hypothetical protein